jgi:hypothetical protein
MRDLRLDFFRGLALLFIFLDHIPENYVNYLTLGNFVFSDAAELFVFISGYTAALVFGGVMQRQGVAFATAQVLKRCWTLYVAHIFLFVIYTAQVSYTAQRFKNPMFVDEMNIANFLQEPHIAVVKALTLALQPTFLNILPLYIVLLLLLAAILPLLRRWPLHVLAASALMYLSVPLFKINLETYPGGQWYFNPFAWQFLFVIGAIMGTAGGLGVEMFRRQRWIFWAASGVLVLCVAVRVPMTIADLVGDSPAAFSAAVWQFGDKTSLGPLRLFNFLALAYVVMTLARPENPAFGSMLARPVVLCGQHSLNIFCLGIFLSVAGHVVLIEGDHAWELQVLVSIGGIALMFAVARFLAWSKAGSRMEGAASVPERTLAPRSLQGGE